jgi:hypothetical protein
MIGVLTANFSFYYDLIKALRKRKIPFISLCFNDEIPINVNVIITSHGEESQIEFEHLIIWKKLDKIETVIDRAFLISNTQSVDLVFGIDPGDNIGIAIYGNQKFIRSFILKSPEDTFNFIKTYIKDIEADNVIVRIGDGARIIRNRIINMLARENIAIEIVDESVLPKVDDDTVAASTIAMGKGKKINGELSIEPKKGELKELQRTSREKSKTITISKELAKKVLQGEISLDSAIELQKREDQA